VIVLGVDPGLNATGYGLMRVEDGALTLVAAGDIRPPKKQPLTVRLEFLHEALSQLIARHRPATMVLEMVFTHQSYVTTAALMAHARGVACLAAQQHGLTLAEYSPARVKKALTGNGNASKTQVARMVGQWLGRDEASLSSDATDALALAIAHVHMDSRSITTRTKKIRNAEFGIRSGQVVG
jgi:crossover junction endodeoxyribonuclease RuvC